MAEAAVPGVQGPRQQDAAAEVELDLLKFDGRTSDRFVYTQFFVPFVNGGVPLNLAPVETGEPQLTRPRGKGREGSGSAAARRRAAATATAASRAAAHIGPGVKISKRGAPVPTLNALAVELTSPFGLLFLDRTRVRPGAAVLGEQLLSLSLAPGEQVVLEQKSFSQRETTYEQQDETTAEHDLELESTLTTAFESALTVQQAENHSTTTGTKTDLGASLKASGKLEGVEASGGINASIDTTFANTVADANTSSQTSSLKRTTQTTQKVASKYRAMHKTTMRISTQQQFTTSSQRTVRNPNVFTALDLRYYKIYQEVELSHERYGVRLAWAPTIWSPGQAVAERAAAAYRAVIAAAVASATLPPAPVLPAPANQQLVDSETEQLKGGENFFGNPAPWNEWYTKTIPIRVPPPGAGWMWDGVRATVKPFPTIVKPGLDFESRVESVAIEADGGITVEVFVAWKESGEVNLFVQANFIEAKAAELAEYNQKLAMYQAEVTAIQGRARAEARPEALAAKKAVLDEADPLAECFGQLTKAMLHGRPAAVAVYDVWRTLFEWDKAAVVPFPGWWYTGQEPVDPESPPDAFVNTAGARLYLPVRPGLEGPAAELIALVERNAASLTPLAALIDEAEKFREQHFGGPSEIAPVEAVDETGETTLAAGAPAGQCPAIEEQFICMGAWTELLPTEGTHLEVVQASTSAADELNEQRLKDDVAQRQARITLIDSQGALQEALRESAPQGPVNLTVDLHGADGHAHSESTDTSDPPRGR
jgi:hypothetical protein